MKRTGVARALVALLAVAGCAGEGDNDADRDRPAERAPDTSETEAGAGDNQESPTCRLLTTDEVGDLFGLPARVVPGEADIPVADGAVTCLWEASTDGQPAATIHQLQLSVFAGDETFDPTAWGGTPEPVPDLGDEAFVVPSGGLLGTTAGYREAGRTVILSYAVPIAEDPPDTAAQADQVVELLRTVHDRLG